MRCGCPQCGIYMVQRENGLRSECVCPDCLFVCNACMGTEQPPMQVEELQRHIWERLAQRHLEQD